MRNILHIITTNQKMKLASTLFALSASALFVMFSTINATAQSSFQGSLESVAISNASGTSSPPVASFTHTRNGDTFAFDASTSTDSAGNITEYQWDFGDGSTGSGVTISHQFAVGTFPVTLTVIDNIGGVALKQVPIVTAPAVSFAFNFTSKWATAAEGYLTAADQDSFSTSVGYGWVQPASGSIARNSTRSPDKAYDTFTKVLPTSIWEFIIPNGTYSITICMGDGSYPAGDQYAQAEGIPVIDGLPISTSGDYWVERTKTITVSDGKLTLGFKGTLSWGRLCWIKITN